MKIGYARVSDHEQTHTLQLEVLRAADCERVYQDICSGKVPCARRPQFQEAMACLREGDTLVTWRLDRLGHRVSDLVHQVVSLAKHGIGLETLKEGLTIDYNTATGKMQFHVFAMLAEFQNDVDSERTLAGLAAARARGRKGGRKAKLTGKALQQAGELMREKRLPVNEIARMAGVSRSTIYRHLNPDGSPRRTT